MQIHIPTIQKRWFFDGGTLSKGRGTDLQNIFGSGKVAARRAKGHLLVPALASLCPVARRCLRFGRV